MPADNDIDYRTLSREQLDEALTNIDAPRFPENYKHLIAEIAARDGGRAPEPPPKDPWLVKGASLECRREIATIIVLIAMCLGLIIVGCYCLTLPDPTLQVAGAVGVPLVSFGLVAWIRRAFMDGPVVTISEVSILDRRTFKQPLNWSEVRSVWGDSIQLNRFLCVLPIDPDAYVRSLTRGGRFLARLNREFGYPPLTISFVGLSPGATEALEYIRRVQPNKLAV